MSTRSRYGDCHHSIVVCLAQNRLGPGAVVATVFADDNKKYLTTDLLREEPVREGYLSPEVELAGFDTFKRVCHTRCEFPE